MKLVLYIALSSCMISSCSINQRTTATPSLNNINELPVEGGTANLNQFNLNKADVIAANYNFQKNQAKHKQGTTKNINDYARGIMQDLINNMQYVSSATPMAVASFVMLDSNFKTGSLLGNQLAESFINEIHKYGIPVIDVKASDAISITSEGDFILSRDISKLTSELPILYVLAGTLVKNKGGYLINARIIAVESKAVVATAQGFLPNHVSETLQESYLYSNDGIISSNR